MKKYRIIYILAITSVWLLASCNLTPHDHSCDNHSNHEHTVNDSIKK